VVLRPALGQPPLDEHEVGGLDRARDDLHEDFACGRTRRFDLADGRRPRRKGPDADDAPGQVRDPSKRGATLLGAGAGIDRCRLFLLTALSESGVAIGTAVASAQITGITIVTGTAPLVGTTALWSLAFGRTGRLVSGHMEETREPARCRARRGECLQ
jgi:hypothetical protein